MEDDRSINKVVTIKLRMDEEGPSMRPVYPELEKGVEDAIKSLNDDGYEVVQIIPIMGGWGKEIENNLTGYGFSFTDAVTILGKKVNN
jgi:hypothetical protein